MKVSVILDHLKLNVKQSCEIGNTMRELMEFSFIKGAEFYEKNTDSDPDKINAQAELSKCWDEWCEEHEKKLNEEN